MATKALLVGINRYPGAPLNGCVNDIVDMANFLTKKAGFDPKNVRMLTDGRATTAAIIERLRWLVSNVRPGDKIFFHYSGHGAQVATRSPSGEADGMDEVLCPVDFDWTDAHMIRDKQLHGIFESIPKGVQAIWVSDSCHSGDLSRDLGLGGRTAKRLLPPEDISWRNTSVGGDKAVVKLAATDFPNIALISGCRSDQTSADAFFNGRYNGALTYHLLHALNKGMGKSCLSDLLQAVRTSLKVAHFEQEPQLDCTPDMQKNTFFV